MHFIKKHVDDKSGYPHTAECFFLGNQNEPQLHALTCINLKNSKLRKKNIQKKMHHMIALCKVKKLGK